MSDYLTNLAQRAMKPTAVKPRLRPLYADPQTGPVQEVFEERGIEQASPANRVTGVRPAAVNEAAIQAEAPRGDGTQPAASESETTHMSRMDRGLEEAIWLMPALTEAEPAGKTLPAMSSALAARADADPQSSARDVQSLNSMREPALRTGILPLTFKLSEDQAQEDSRGERHTGQDKFRAIDDLSAQATDSAKRLHRTSSPRATARLQEESQSDRLHVPGQDTAVASESPAAANPLGAQAAREPTPRTDFALYGDHVEQANGLDARQSQEQSTLRPVTRRQDLRRPDFRDDARAEQEMTIEISIGRVDIRAATAPPPAERRSAAASPAKSSLDLYLEKQRAGVRA